MPIIGYIVNYRIGPRTQNPRECIIQFPSINSDKEAAKLIGRKIAWPIGERKIRGVIVDVHGRKGRVRARFRKGLPGHALGTMVEII